MRFALTTLALVCPLTAAASLVDYEDRGRTTYDAATGLEWLDVAETVNRSRLDIAAELTDPSSSLSLEGWRYATRAEFRAMVSNFFGSALVAGQTEVSDASLMQPFHALFGNTWGIWCTHESCLPGGVIANTDGVLGDPAPNRGLPVPEFYQGIVTTPASVPGNSAGYIESDTYRSGDTRSWGVGSWLIRGTQSVPEPATPALIMFGLCLLLATARRLTLR